ncbi:hypothetical protein [uncultured Parabacteroides sp.]|uniref:hypothetical protein n=1 Tax=uncultured Parabacteroides sp. TaxID=512312 RepID=UPI0028041A84|nr:hypothetical protein [uncultured Parabacteroides sp.]
MKLKNILSVICILLAVVSCSMEDEVLDGNSTNLILEKGAAYVTVDISTAKATTKAVSRGESHINGSLAGDYINSCYLLLLDNDGNIVNRAFATELSGTTVKYEKNILVKVGAVTKIIAVVNGSHLHEKLDACTTLSQIRAIRDDKAEHRVKVGEGTISWPEGFEGSSSTTGNLPSVTVSIEAVQRTAVVDLTGFYVKYMDGVETTEVRLTEAWFTNLKKNTGLFEEGTGDFYDTKNLIPMEILDSDKGEMVDNILKPSVLDIEAKVDNFKDHIKTQGTPLNHTNCFFSAVFPNTVKTNPVTLHLAFTVDGKRETRDYVINPDRATNTTGHGWVEPGNWYRLNVIVHVTAAGIESLEVVGWNEVLIGGNNGVEFK